METNIKELSRYFQQIGAADLIHTGEKSYLAHVIGVANDLRKWGYDDDLYRAGLFHSIYGTERFQRFTLPLEKREEIRAMIGERAERLAYWNCAMDRASFDHSVLNEDEPPSFVDRITGERCELTADDFRDLMALHLCDWLEQAPRAKSWDYRRESYCRMAERLGGPALQSCEEVYRLNEQSV